MKANTWENNFHKSKQFIIHCTITINIYVFKFHALSNIIIDKTVNYIELNSNNNNK